MTFRRVRMFAAAAAAGGFVAVGVVGFGFAGAAYALTTPSISTSQQPGSAVVGSSIADNATVSGSSFTCPATDLAGRALEASNATTSTIFCRYETVPNDFFCRYFADTGLLEQDHDAGFCPPVADIAAPTGTVTFNLYDNSTASGTPLFTDTENLVSGAATSAGFAATATGTDYWVATYNGDSNFNPVTSGPSGEPVTITAASTTGTPPTGSPPTGSPPTGSPPTGTSPTGTPLTTLTTPPSFSGVAQSHRRWRLGGTLASFAAPRRPPVGTTIRFTLNEAATVGFAFAQLLPGRKLRNGKCVAQTAANRRHKACTRSVSRGSFSFNAGAGLHKLFFQGRLTRTRKLKPGTYTLTMTATNAAGQRTTKTLSPFTIVPG